MNYAIIVMPALGIIFTMMIIIVLIVVWGKTKQAQILAVNRRSFEEFACEMKEDVVELKSKLTAIEENLNSIHKMIKDVE